MSATPQVTRVYQNHHLDSTRWEVIRPRAGDIIVTTSYKSGTTWAQQIVQGLLSGDEDPGPDVRATSPWPDARFMGISREDLANWAEGLTGRRYFKSHLPLDGLPYYPEAKYLIVARDARDVFMSFFNHYSNYTETAFMALNAPDAVGDPLPPCPEDPRALWNDWMTRGWFDWESEGYPFWSNLHHTQTYWDFKHLPNFLMLHYNDMLRDLEGAVRQIAEFAEIDVTAAHIDRVVEKTTFANARKRAVEGDTEGAQRVFFKGGAESFFFKGSNGRWRDVLTEADLELYEQAKRRVLSDDCAKWLENGSLG